MEDIFNKYRCENTKRLKTETPPQLEARPLHCAECCSCRGMPIVFRLASGNQHDFVFPHKRGHLE